MIVRILGDGQYRLDDAGFEAVNAIDDRVQAAADANDEAAFSEALAELVAAVRSVGTPLAVDEFVGSDAMIPDVDISLTEAREMLDEEGLVPDTK